MRKVKALLLTTAVSFSVLSYKNIYAMDDVYVKQLETKDRLLIEALDNLGPKSKEEAVMIYSGGIKKRSGPMQYSAMSGQLKADFIKKMNNNENYAWVTGTSSPWVKHYAIGDYHKITENLYSVSVDFILETSSGYFDTSRLNLQVENINQSWFITSIKIADSK